MYFWKYCVFRLVVEMNYREGIVWVKFIGTHAQYDKINVENINEYSAYQKSQRFLRGL
ncbi:type II toxin-antitoxin system HigB family toxin [Methylotuvimicrobium sp. KM2]|uniref:type II toxin-antitoxin system HigB family toxin n=1 Tax=Methylotuvimicrobium sp. KM2 TaxID=3133976 RepID=UPI0031017649